MKNVWKWILSDLNFSFLTDYIDKKSTKYILTPRILSIPTSQGEEGEQLEQSSMTGAVMLLMKYL